MIVLFYTLNVISIALPLALFEIWLEKFKSGWNGEFLNQFWGKKISLNFLNILAEKKYVTPYHLIMFGIVLPGIFISEYFVLRYFAKNTGWILSFDPARIIPIIFLPAVWLGVAVLEDFFWFALNWRFPNALERLFRGHFAWHTDWIRIVGTSVLLPRFYVTVSVAIGVLLIVQNVITRTSSR